jgi:hypothetical protein
VYSAALTDNLFSVNGVVWTVIHIFFIFSPWRYTTHSGCVFYSPLSGFSLFAYEVTFFRIFWGVGVLNSAIFKLIRMLE